MLRWLRQLVRRTPVAPITKPQFARLAVHPLEDRVVPATFNVTITADSGAGSLRDAIAQANSTSGADTIVFQGGLGAVTLTTDQLALTDTSGATTISGPSGGTQVVQRSTAGGTPTFRIFRVNSGVTAVFNNLTVSNGNIAGSGALGSGAGISNAGTLTVTNSTVSSNTATSYAGGIDNNSGTLTVTNSTISGNSAVDSGGGISSNNSLTVTNSTLSGNTSNSYGGGLSIDGGTATLTNVTVTGNRSDDNNSGGETGGGLLRTGATVTLNNTLVAGNFRGTGITRDDVSGAVTAASANNLIGDGTNLTGMSNGNNGNQIGTAASPVDPLLGPLQDNGGQTKTHAPGLNSPAVGRASAAVAGYSIYDQRGTPRDYEYPDVGAFEVQHPLATVGAPTTHALTFTPRPSGTADEAFIKGLFRTTLLREASAADVAAWLPYMPQGRAFVANGFVNSIENRDNQVRFFFRYFLGRDSDYAGIAYYRDLLRGGTSETEVIRRFILSPEFTAANDNARFVSVMYYSMLGRTPSTGDFNIWVNLLNGGMDRGTASDSFLRSPEGIRRVIRGQFQTYLKRSVDDAGADSFQSYSFGQAAVILLSSAEFYAYATANMT